MFLILTVQQGLGVSNMTSITPFLKVHRHFA
jgi:hypothetical protein